MPFNSHTAKLAGQKSKRKKEHGNDNLRFELLDFSKELIQDLKSKDLDIDQKLKLLRVVLSYSMPKLKMSEVQNIDFSNGYTPVNINIATKKEINNAIKKFNDEY